MNCNRAPTVCLWNAPDCILIADLFKWFPEYNNPSPPPAPRQITQSKALFKGNQAKQPCEKVMGCVGGSACLPAFMAFGIRAVSQARQMVVPPTYFPGLGFAVRENSPCSVCQENNERRKEKITSFGSFLELDKQVPG